MIAFEAKHHLHFVTQDFVFTVIAATSTVATAADWWKLVVDSSPMSFDFARLVITAVGWWMLVVVDAVKPNSINFTNDVDWNRFVTYSDYLVLCFGSTSIVKAQAASNVPQLVVAIFEVVGLPDYHSYLIVN